MPAHQLAFSNVYLGRRRTTENFSYEIDQMIGLVQAFGTQLYFMLFIDESYISVM